MIKGGCLVMIKFLYIATIIFVSLCVTLLFAAPIRLIPDIIKIKLYQHDTIALIWYDTMRDGQCNTAELIEKIDDYFLIKKIKCKQADEIDAFILEPCI
jgi:hypothetical protein